MWYYYTLEKHRETSIESNKKINKNINKIRSLLFNERNLSYLKDFSCNILLTHFTLYPKLDLVVPLTVGNTIPEQENTYSYLDISCAGC